MKEPQIVVFQPYYNILTKSLQSKKTKMSENNCPKRTQS
jgi:hypothetical protein